MSIPIVSKIDNLKEELNCLQQINCHFSDISVVERYDRYIYYSKSIISSCNKVEFYSLLNNDYTDYSVVDREFDCLPYVELEYKTLTGSSAFVKIYWNEQPIRYVELFLNQLKGVNYTNYLVSAGFGDDIIRIIDQKCLEMITDWEGMVDNFTFSDRVQLLIPFI